MNDSWDSEVVFLIKLASAVVWFFVWWIIAANISDTRAPRTAETLGFTEVEVHSSTIWFTGLRGCGVSDMKMWRVSGLDSSGVRRNFIVCGGAFKGNAIRVK